MAFTQNVGNLIVKLLGDGSHYQKMLTRVQATTARVGAALTRSITLPVVGAGALAVREFGKFDQAMTESTSIMGNLTDRTKNEMRELAKALATEGKQGPEELARSYFYLASAGMNAKDAMAALPVVQKFATAGAFDMAKATDLLTDAQSALGMNTGTTSEKMQNMARLSDVLVKANTLANATVEQFSTALTTKSGAALKTFGKDAEEGVAVLAAMADQGVKAELAGNNLSRIMLLLSKASLDNRAALDKFNVQVFDSQGSMRNFADIIQDLENAFRGMSDEQKAAALAEMGFEARVQGAVLPLIGMSQQIRQYEAGLRAAGGITQEVAAKQMVSFVNSMKKVWNTVKVAAMEIGEKLVPTIRSMGEWIQKQVVWWKGLDVETQKFYLKLVALAAAAGPALMIISKLTIVLGGVGKVIAVATASVGAFSASLAALAIAGIAVASVALYRHLAMTKEYNEALRESNRLLDEQVKRTAKEGQKTMQQAASIEDLGKRWQYLALETDRAERNLKGMAVAEREAIKQLQLAAGIKNPWQRAEEIKLARREIEEIQTRYKAQKELVDQLRDAERGVYETIKTKNLTQKAMEGRTEEVNNAHALVKQGVSYVNQLKEQIGLTGSLANMVKGGLKNAAGQAWTWLQQLWDKANVPIRFEYQHNTAVTRGSEELAKLTWDMMQKRTPEENLGPLNAAPGKEGNQEELLGKILGGVLDMVSQDKDKPKLFLKAVGFK